ncbi:MAG: hypothetical protein ACK4K9_11240 [Bacteroidia bacterium]
MANKLAVEINCEIAEIKPMFKNVVLLFLMSFLKINIPIKIEGKQLTNYDEIIIFGPVWGGLLISPLRTAIKKCIKANKKFHFAITCESGQADKDTEYGYNHVFGLLDKYAGYWVLEKTAFSSTLVKNFVAKKSVTETKVQITDENYSDALHQKILDFANKITHA